MKSTTRQSAPLARLAATAVALITFAQADAGTLVETVSEPFGTFNGVDYVRHTGRFVGKTPKGEFRVPFEIVAPADSREGNRTVVFEPPHFIFGTAGRDATLGHDLLFGRRFSHASVGFSNEGYNLLDPTVGDAVIAGHSVLANVPVAGELPPFPRDVEILKQFAEALVDDPTAAQALGRLKRRYAYGVSQSAEAMYELFYGPGAAGIFDVSVLYVPLWRPAFARPDVLATLPDEFTPLPDIGKVMLVSAEGDLLISRSLQLRNAAPHPNYRVYEVAGAPHLAQDVVVDNVRTNPLDLAPVVRAAFVAGHRWQVWNHRPPQSRLLAPAGDGEIDPVYMVPTGIGRDPNGNAAGGVRFPDVANGRALHIASALDVEVIPGLPGLIGLWFDLACAPVPLFDSHRDYVRSVWRYTLTLLWQRLILPVDANALIQEALASDVGKPGSCSAAP